MSDWQAPPTTRWWLETVTEVGALDTPTTHLCLVVEHGEHGDDECPVAPPARPIDHGPHATDVHADWLSSCGIGVTTTWERGAHGWIDWITTRRREPRKRPRKKRPTQEAML